MPTIAFVSTRIRACGQNFKFTICLRVCCCVCIFHSCIKCANSKRRKDVRPSQTKEMEKLFVESKLILDNKQFCRFRCKYDKMHRIFRAVILHSKHHTTETRQDEHECVSRIWNWATRKEMKWNEDEEENRNATSKIHMKYIFSVAYCASIFAECLSQYSIILFFSAISLHLFRVHFSVRHFVIEKDQTDTRMERKMLPTYCFCASRLFRLMTKRALFVNYFIMNFIELARDARLVRFVFSPLCCCCLCRCRLCIHHFSLDLVILWLFLATADVDKNQRIRFFFSLDFRK